MSTSLRQPSHLDVTINQPIQLDVIIVFTKWIDENLGNLQPADVEAKLSNELQ